jgi:hypothetical protein
MNPYSLAWSLRVLNILDAGGTVYLVSVKGLDEANPIMRWLLEVHPLLFVFVKVLTVGLCAEFLARRNACWTLAIVNVVYVIVVAMHAALVFG